MTTATEALFTPVQYFTALDPYNWRVDNRPLSDLSDNDVTLSEGIETAFHSGKLNSAALGSTLRALAGNGRMMGAFTVSGSALTANILYSVFTLTANVSGKTVSLVGLQPDLVSFALTAPAAGYKKLHTIAAKYQSPDLDLPYFDSSLALDGSQIATGSLEYEVTSSTVALAGAETYPTPGSGFTEVIRIKVLATDTVIDPTNVTYPNFVLEGQAFNYASQTRAGQVLFANSTDLTAGTSTTKAVSVADLASIVSGIPSIPEASQTAHGTVRYATNAEVIAGTSTDRVVTPADLKGRINAIPASPAGNFVTTTDGLKYGINANLRVPPNYLGPTVDFNTVLTSGKWFCEATGPGLNRPPFSSDGILTVEGSAETAYGAGFWIQSYVDNTGRTYSRRIYNIVAAFPGNTIFGRWTESFTRYRVVEVSNVTTPPGTVGVGPCLINLTAEDFSHHTMIVVSMYAVSGVNVEIRVAVGEVSKLRLGEMVHIRKFSSGAGNKDVTIIDEAFTTTHNPHNVGISPFTNYVMPRNNSTISLVVTKINVSGGGNHTVTLSIVGEMP